MLHRAKTRQWEEQRTHEAGTQSPADDGLEGPSRGFEDLLGLRATLGLIAVQQPVGGQS
jgi:hypothetical protein